MTRLIAALLILVACGVAPAGHAQDDCDEEAIAAGECGDEAAQADDADAEGTGEEDMADAESQAEDENVEPMADDDSGDEDVAADDSADMNDAAETDEAAGADTAAAGAEEEESDDDFDAEIAVATDDDDDDADAASGDDLLSTPQLGDPDAPPPPSSGPSVPASQNPAPPVTQTPAPPVATPKPTPSAGTPAPAAPANCNGGFSRSNGRCPTAPAPAQTGTMTIYVGNLSWDMSEDELKDLFAPYGTVSQAKIVTDKFKNNRSKGFGFVTMPDRAEAQAAIDGLHQTEIMGRKLIVNDSQPQSGR